MEELQNVIVEYYKSREKRVVLDDVFCEWADQKAELGDIKGESLDRYKNDYKRSIENAKSSAGDRILVLTPNARETVNKVMALNPDIDGDVDDSIIGSHIRAQSEFWFKYFECFECLFECLHQRPKIRCPEAQCLCGFQGT